MERGRPDPRPRKSRSERSQAPHPSDPNWKDFPVELKVQSFQHMITSEIAHFYPLDQHYKSVIDENEAAIASPIISREIRRIRESYDINGQSFIDALRMWMTEKGVAVDRDWLAYIGLAFVWRYMAYHNETDPELCRQHHMYAAALLYLYVLTHTPQTIWDAVLWGCTNEQPSDFTDEEFALRTLKSLGLFPQYADMPSSADTIVEHVKTDPNFFGGVTGRYVAAPRGRCSLTSLSMVFPDDMPLKNPPWIESRWQAQCSDLVQGYLYTELTLDHLPVGLVYHVEGPEAVYSIDQVVHKHLYDKKASRLLDKAMILEQIKVM